MCKSLWDISVQHLLFSALVVVVKHQWRESSDQMSMAWIWNKWGKGLFWTFLMLKVRRLSQPSAVSGIRLMAPELGPSCPWIVHGKRQGSALEHSRQPLSMPVTLPGHLRSARASLALSAGARPCSFVSWYSASPCPSCASSYPWGQILSASGYFMALLA